MAGKIHEKLQYVTRAFRVADEDERNVGLDRPLLEEFGDLASIVRRSGSPADDNRIDTVTAVTERTDCRSERPGVFTEALTEGARYQEYLQRRRDSRLPCLGPGRLDDAREGKLG